MSGAGHASLVYAGATDRGQVREGNEDSYLATPHVLGVADGMGGHAAGEIASRTAVETLARVTRRRGKRTPAQALTDAIREANDIILERGEEYHQLQGMGTTVTAGVIEDGTLTIAHVGDSRAYLMRDAQLEQITEDHSWVAEMVRDGRLTPEEAENHPQRSVITRALGAPGPLEVDIVQKRLHPGDRILFATDGLTGVLPDQMIARTLRNDAPLGDLCSRLIAQANVRGGPDNITVVIADYVDEPRGGRHRHTVWRPVLVLSLAFALLAAAGLGWGYWSLASAYYIAFEGQEVVIYQGVPEEVLGQKLYRIYRRTGIMSVELTPYFQERVAQGIPVTGSTDADRVIQQLILSRTPVQER